MSERHFGLSYLRRRLALAKEKGTPVALSQGDVEGILEEVDALTADRDYQRRRADALAALCLTPPEKRSWSAR